MAAMTKEERAKKELSDFLNNENGRIPYSCPNWNLNSGRMHRPYEQNSSFSDKYRAMSPLEQTQHINEEDIPKDVDWTLPETVVEETPVKQKNYRWVMALAFLTAFSVSYCSNSPKAHKNEQNEREFSRPINHSNYEQPAFRQGPKK